MTSNGPPNLTVSTSLSPSSSSSFGGGTPEKRTDAKGVLRERHNLTPPARANTIRMALVKEKVNFLLAPVKKSWDQLTLHEQAKISYLLMRNQDTFLKRVCTPDVAAQMVLASLDETNFHGKGLNAFVRKGGDIVVNDDGEYAIPSPYESFVNGHDEWLDAEAAPTLFNHPEQFSRVAKPLLWLQEDTSTVCYLVSIAIAIYYSQCMHNGTKRIGAR
jgi:hypothetical protein